MDIAKATDQMFDEIRNGVIFGSLFVASSAILFWLVSGRRHHRFACSLAHRPSISMTPTAKLRWPRFTLRTLFVMVTVFGVWLGWQIHFVRERQALRNWFRTSQTLLDAEVDTIRQPPSIPIWRKWLGDEPATYIWLHVPNDEEMRRVRYFFPEAEVQEYVF